VESKDKRNFSEEPSQASNRVAQGGTKAGFGLRFSFRGTGRGNCRKGGIVCEGEVFLDLKKEKQQVSEVNVRLKTFTERNPKKRKKGGIVVVREGGGLGSGK